MRTTLSVERALFGIANEDYDITKDHLSSSDEIILNKEVQRGIIKILRSS